MKNYEKYEDEIREFKDSNFCRDFIRPRILKSDNCAGIHCAECYRRQFLWLLEDYEEPETDWNKVEVDTPILVKQGENGTWIERHFAKYKNGIIYTWKDGHTSWTEDNMIGWKYAKLPEEEKDYEEPKVDWSKIEVDTPILVRNSEDEEWRKRYFAKYDKYGFVYTWRSGRTSWTEEDLSVWSHAKLAEDGGGKE